MELRGSTDQSTTIQARRNNNVNCAALNDSYENNVSSSKEITLIKKTRRCESSLQRYIN